MVPEKYRNVICPWQTHSEIKAQSKTLDKVFAKMDQARAERLLGLDRPDRKWIDKGCV